MGSTPVAAALPSRPAHGSFDPTPVQLVAALVDEMKKMYYEAHIYANYLLIALITLHILAVIAHHILFKDKIIKNIL